MIVDRIEAKTNELIPQGDVERQAVDSLRGYAYQVIAATLAWLDIQERSRIFLEVAEDYAVVAKDAITAIQVKHTQGSTKITLNTESVRAAIINFVTLVADNQAADVHLRYFTTSEIGTEKLLEDRPDGMAGLNYWRKAAKRADVEPLRKILDSAKFPETVREFVRSRSDDGLRRDLLRKIHWDCGKPDIVSLRKELSDRMIVVGRDIFQLPAQDAAQLVDNLIFYVLQKSIVNRPEDRVLTRADLISLVDSVSRVSVPKTTFDFLARLIPQFSEFKISNLPVSFDLPAWLVNGKNLPKNSKMIPRLGVKEGIDKRLHNFGTCFVVGASGVGKSSVSRSVVEKISKNYFIVDFRNADVDETRIRLTTLVSRLGGLNTEVILLEDLNYLNDPALLMTIAHTFGVLDRRDILVIVTSYLAPTSKMLSNIDIKQSAIIECPYFSELETRNLVKVHGGDPEIWGKIAHVSGAFGHPQLVNAFITGMSAREWPLSEIASIIKTGLSTGDVDAEREIACRTLVTALPCEARNLLYRLSLLIGNFERSVVLEIASVSPPIVQAGESLDILIGAWVEQVGRDIYRISPLASSSGKGMIPSDLQKKIHGTIASHFISDQSINVSDIEKIILHAILGKNEYVLLMIAVKILTSDDQLINFLAENTSILTKFNYRKPIYEDNLEISQILRLMQFKILTATQDDDRIIDCINALRKETKLSDSRKIKDEFRLLVLSILLNTIGIANYLDDWIELLCEFKKISDTYLSSSEYQPIEEKNYAIDENVIGILFTIGSVNLANITRLQKVLEQIDLLNTEERNNILYHVKEVDPDFSVLINNPWVLERPKILDVSDAAEKYLNMAKLTQNWEIRSITMQCWVARAIILEELAKDYLGALKVLDEATMENGDDILISKTRAKILLKNKDHKGAFEILNGIADKVDKDNYVERAFTLREAAISAANCNEWQSAEKWFLESKVYAEQIDLPNMKAMSIGLGADAAVAAFNLERVEQSLEYLAQALIELGKMKQDSSLQANSCHHMIRHTVLWVLSRLDGSWDTLPNGDPIIMKPGICSSPNPNEGIVERPLAHLDHAWYLLADCELKSLNNLGISNRLHERLVDGPILLLEISFRFNRLLWNIVTINSEGFVFNLLSYIEGMKFKSELNQEIFEMSDLSTLNRQLIPFIPTEDLKQSFDQYADDAVLAFAVACACKYRSEEFLDLGSRLDAHFGEGHVCDEIFVQAKLGAQHLQSRSLNQLVIHFIMKFQGDNRVSPIDYCLGGIYLFLYAEQSVFKKDLISMIATWQRKAWVEIIASQKIFLYLPFKTIPEIQKSLLNSSNTESFLCSLLLAVSKANNVSLPSSIALRFEELSS